MKIYISFNNKNIYKAGSDEFMCSEINPVYGFTLYTPSISYNWNKRNFEDYSDKIYSLVISAPTNCDLVYSDEGLYYRIAFRVLGFGICFYKQACY